MDTKTLKQQQQQLRESLGRITELEQLIEESEKILLSYKFARRLNKNSRNYFTTEYIRFFN